MARTGPLNNPAYTVIASGKELARAAARKAAGRHGNRCILCRLQIGGRLIPFTKAHACGNDFLIVTEEAAGNQDRVDLTRRLCSRNTGIGADGIEFFAWNELELAKPDSSGPKSGRIRLYNADGSIAEISGNGTRCVAAWMAETLGSKPGDVLAIATDAGLRLCRIDKVRNQSRIHGRNDHRHGRAQIYAAHPQADRRLGDCRASKSPPAILTLSSWPTIRNSPLPVNSGKPSARRFARIAIFRSTPTWSLCAS